MRDEHGRSWRFQRDVTSFVPQVRSPARQHFAGGHRKSLGHRGYTVLQNEDGALEPWIGEELHLRRTARQ